MLSKKIVPNNISMTGEVTLNGKLLPIGGIKEKLIAAYTSGITKVYIPLANTKDLEEIDKEVIENLEIVPVEDYMEIYNDLFK